jgi:hypothetical protein
MFDGPTINVIVSANIATVEIHLTVWAIVVPSDSASIEPRFCGRLISCIALPFVTGSPAGGRLSRL